MPRSALEKPQTDATKIFEHFRNCYATDLLTAAVIEFNLFERLGARTLSFDAFRNELGLDARPANVLFTALRAMNLLEADALGNLKATPQAIEHLTPDAYFGVGGYVSLVSDFPSVQSMIRQLKTNRPADNHQSDPGAAFIHRDGLESAMNSEASARRLTLALAGRAKNVAPYLVEQINLRQSKLLIDVGGGTGIYAIACAQYFPNLKAIVWDRPEVLKVAQEMIVDYGVTERVSTVPGDMFKDPIPPGADAILLSNILHDWDVPECLTILKRCYDALPQGGQLFIHDVFLDDDLGGPLHLALYSAALFTLTEGRAYAAAEYHDWLKQTGFTSDRTWKTTGVHCGVIVATK